MAGESKICFPGVKREGEEMRAAAALAMNSMLALKINFKLCSNNFHNAIRPHYSPGLAGNSFVCPRSSAMVSGNAWSR